MWLAALFACGTPGPSVQPTPAPIAPVPAAEPPSAQPTWVLPPLPDLSERPTDCALTLDGLTPMLVNPQQGKSPVVLTRNGRILEEFHWPNGVPVRVIQEGCAHIAIVEQYGLAAEPADLYAKAVELSSALQTVPGHESHAVRLKQVGKLEADGTFPCGDAHCDVRLIDDGPNPVLEIRYDFAL